MTPLQRRALLTIAGSQLFALTLWFSATAVAPQLETAWNLDSGETAGLTLAVQIGFVAGAILLAITNLADTIPARRLFASAAVVGSLANAAIVLVDGRVGLALLLRFGTGLTLAGVYPSGLKVMAGWFESGRGLALGALVGALTIGSAGPHLIRGFGLDWQGVVLTASALALVSAGAMLGLATDGPYDSRAHRFEWRRVREVIGNRGFRLSTYGYLGHMWELYAMWTWTAAFLTASAVDGGYGTGHVAIATFFTIAAGGAGAYLFGMWADRYGRTRLAGLSLAISGGIGLASPLIFGAHPIVVVAVFLVWGFAVVADSAQFSAMVTETSEPQDRGTALALQTAMGFLLTIVTIRLVPMIAESQGWNLAFLVLVPGPVAGLWAMAALRRSPYVQLLAGGRG